MAWTSSARPSPGWAKPPCSSSRRCTSSSPSTARSRSSSCATRASSPSRSRTSTPASASTCRTSSARSSTEVRFRERARPARRRGSATDTKRRHASLRRAHHREQDDAQDRHAARHRGHARPHPRPAAQQGPQAREAEALRPRRVRPHARSPRRVHSMRKAGVSAGKPDADRSCATATATADMRKDIQEIFRSTPHQKQVMMFTATMSKEIRPVCKKFCQDVNNHTPPHPRHRRQWNTAQLQRADGQLRCSVFQPSPPTLPSRWTATAHLGSHQLLPAALVRGRGPLTDRLLLARA